MKIVLPMPFINNQYIKEQSLIISISLVLITAVLGFKWYNSIALLLLALSCLLFSTYREFVTAIKKPFTILCILFFLFFLIPFLFDPTEALWFEAEKKLGFVFLPLIMSMITPLNRKTWHKIMMIVCVFAVIMMITLFIFAFSKYLQRNDISVFFYHELVSPINHHAIYLSAYLGLCSFFLLLNMREQGRVISIQLTLFIFLLISIFFLSSKSILLTVLMLLLWETGNTVFTFNKKKNVLFIVTGFFCFLFILTAINNPLTKRFKELYNTDLKILSTDTYAPDMYFNAVQFRLVAWKFSWQIIKESKSYLLGVGAANAQKRLNQKYRDAKMFTGYNTKEEGGYLNMNAHNQFVQTFLQSGLLGLVLLVTLLILLFQIAFQQKNKQLLFTVLLITIFFCSESVLEGQYGIVLFLVFPFIFFIKNDEKNSSYAVPKTIAGTA